MKQPAIGSGASLRRLFMCGHGAATAGGLFKKVGRGTIAWKCAACVAAAGHGK